MRELEARARKGEKGGLSGLLEGMGNYKKKKEMGGEKKRMRKEDGEWCEGKEMRKTWQETFEKVGRKLMEKNGFDDDWQEEVGRETGEWEGIDGWREENGEEEEWELEWGE